MKQDEGYKFIGVINPFDIYPDFVYPIFEKNGKYYFQKTNNTIIDKFNEIKDTFRLEKIIFSNEDNSTLINIKENYYIGDEAIVSFQLNKEKTIISDIPNFIKFINKFVTDDDILIEKIDKLIDNIRQKNIKLKKKKRI